METTGLTPNTAQIDEQFDTENPQTEAATSVEDSTTTTTEPVSALNNEQEPSAVANQEAVQAPENEAEPKVTEESRDEAEIEAQNPIDEQEQIDEQGEESPSATHNEYSGKSRTELVEMLIEIVANRQIQSLRSLIESIKVAFYKVPRTEIEAQKAEFLAQGGNLEDFKPAEDPIEARFKEVMNIYRTKRDAYIAGMEQDKSANYDKKLAIIDELKELANGSETLNNTFTAFRELQARWRDTGSVPADKVKDLWDTYHHHVENFYNFVKINKELRDIDLKRNLEAKIELCEQAEVLILDPSATVAFHNLQKLHSQWRETGPVAAEFKEQIWDRFKDASSKINKRHQEYFDIIKEEQVRNLQLKEELCSKVEELVNQPFTTRKEWSDASDGITEIQKVWKTIGFAPKKDNTKIYERFRTACDKFFEAKRNYFGSVKSEMEENLQVKVDLCTQAEALAESEDWKKATEAIIELQKRWKESGTTSRKHSDTVWKRFRAACDRFFERKAAHFNSVDSKFSENLASKLALIEELRQIAVQRTEMTFDTLKDYQRRWSEIGFVPIKQKDAIAKEYKEIIDGLFNTLRGSDHERKIENFKGKLASMKEGGARKINSERERFVSKVRQMESDIQLWENNIGFFAKSKTAESLVGEVLKKIERAKTEIAEIIEKVKIIDQQDESK